MLNTKSFIEKARGVHGNKYDYSKVVYHRCNEKVCIICSKHGEFYQRPQTHLIGCGCPKCGRTSNTQLITVDKWVNKAHEIHGDKYDYSKVEYKGWNEKVCIVCPIHGEFWQKAIEHISRKRGCPHCASEKNLKELFAKGKKSFQNYLENHDDGKYEMVGEYIDSKTPIEFRCKQHNIFFTKTPNEFRYIKTPCPVCREELKKPKSEPKPLPDFGKIFIEKLEQKYPSRFFYEKMIYKNAYTKIVLFDNVIGEWIETTPNSLLSVSKIENALGYEKTKIHTLLFIEKARKIHGDKYDYSKVNYEHSKKKVCIICHEKDEEGNEHGEFWQTPNDHLKKDGCPKCGHRVPWTQETFIEKARKIHGDKYDYSKTIIKNTSKHITIICPEHGEFEIRAMHHLRGSGCPKCCGSGGEKALLNFFEKKGVYPQYNKRYKWLDYYQLDFYFPEYKLAIEVQGEQHFRNITTFGTTLEEQQRRDKKKKEMCCKHNIKLLYFATFNMDFPYKVFTDVNLLWEEIEKIMNKDK